MRDKAGGDEIVLQTDYTMLALIYLGEFVGQRDLKSERMKHTHACVCVCVYERERDRDRERERERETEREMQRDRETE